MKTVNTNLPFDSVDVDVYIKYIDRAEYLHEKGLHTDKSIVELARLIYEKGNINEN